MTEHQFEPKETRMICARCGLIQHRGNEMTPCQGPQLLAGRYQLGNPAVDAEQAAVDFLDEHYGVPKIKPETVDRIMAEISGVTDALEP